MRKVLFALSAAAVLVASQTTLAAELQTAQEKYNALVAAGVFGGVNDIGLDSALDKDMNRAQLAAMVAKLNGLQSDAQAASDYSDISDRHWAAGYIGAAKEAGIMPGHADGTFDPSGDVTVEQLAMVMAKALGLNPVEGAPVGDASDWAKNYVEAALKQGLIATNTESFRPNDIMQREKLLTVVQSMYPTRQVPTQAEIAAEAIRDAVKANPNQAADIVAEAIRIDRSQAELIVRAAISAAPEQAEAIVRAALAAASPDQRDAIIKAALEAAPEQQDAIDRGTGPATNDSPDLPASNPTQTIDTSAIPGNGSGGSGSDGNDPASPNTI